MNARDTLKANGYAVDAVGNLETHREGARYKGSHLAVVRLDMRDSKTAREFAAKVVAAIDEPGAAHGVGRNGIILVFKIGDSYNVEARQAQAEHEFVFEGARCVFASTADAQTIDMGSYKWERSPLTVARDSLAPLYGSVAVAAYEAVEKLLPEYGGRFGPLVLPESFYDRAMRQQAEREAAGIANEVPADPDELLVAANPGISIWDGPIGQNVALARTRIAERKEAARKEQEQEQAAQKKSRLKALFEHVR
jgi:hypothetical protein